jgi:hypothetical protein
MSNIIPFNGADIPAQYVRRVPKVDVNKDIVTVASYPKLSIKGKTFTLVQDNERRVLTKPDDPDEIVQSIQVAFLRINMTSKAFYSKRFTEDDSEGARPDCFSNDGVAPSAQSPAKQANKCALCPHNAFGSAVNEDGTAGKGKRCSDHARIAIADPSNLEKVLLLRVPAKSLKPLKESALKPMKQRQLQYNEGVYRIGFEKESASPTLTFRPVGLLDNDSYEKACDLFDSELVRAVAGIDDDAAVAEPAAAAPSVDTDELDAALAKRQAPAPAPAPAPEKKAKVSESDLASALGGSAKAPEKAKAPAKAKPAPAPAPAPADTSGDDLLGEMSSLLGSIDD